MKLAARREAGCVSSGGLRLGALAPEARGKLRQFRRPLDHSNDVDFDAGVLGETGSLDGRAADGLPALEYDQRIEPGRPDRRGHTGEGRDDEEEQPDGCVRDWLTGADAVKLLAQRPGQCQ